MPTNHASAGPADTKAAADDLARRAETLPEVASVRADLERNGGRTELVQVSLRGDPDDAVDGLVEGTEAVRGA